MNLNQNLRDDRKDNPPYSRLFVVCSKQLKENDLRLAFEKFGEIENINLPRDHSTGDSKGIAYVKYAKTSSAAIAINELNMKTIGDQNKPIKVMVATNKTDVNKSDERFRRLFIKVSKLETNSEIRDHFETFGTIDSVFVVKDKVTDENKGLAYIIYRHFLDAAKAYEECDRKYKPMFAAPREDLKRSRVNSDPWLENAKIPSNPMMLQDQPYNGLHSPHSKRKVESHNQSLDFNTDCSETIIAICHPPVPQKFIEQLFRIPPGMVNCNYTLDVYNSICKASVTYSDEASASYALAKLNNYQFPSGETLSVKFDVDHSSNTGDPLKDVMDNFKNVFSSTNPDFAQLANAITQASTIIKASMTNKMENKTDFDNDSLCNVRLPSPKPLLKQAVVKSCFILCKPHPPPNDALKNVFSRFGDLIDVFTYPNKNYGYVRFASVNAAEQAIKALNGATVCGVKLKVTDAVEKQNSHEDVHYDSCKRPKLNE